MGLSHSPRVVTDSLVLALDAANSFKSAKGFKNILNLSTWTLGTGGVTGFSVNGTVAENQRILDTGPFGVSTVVWDTPSNDVASDADGGWNTSNIDIDPTKMYRFSVWMRRKIIGNGSYYLGCQGINAANTNEGVLNRSDNVVNTNPYFVATNWPTASAPVDAWILVVGHVWPAGSGTGAVHVDTGLYNTSGTKFSAIGDFVWQATNTKTVHRSYLYYSTDTTTRQQWYQPRIDLCDGTEPSVQDLISGVGSRWYNLVDQSNNCNIVNSANLYDSAGYMLFDGVDDYIETAVTPNKEEGSIEMFFYMNQLKDFNTLFDNSLSADDWEMWVYADGRLDFRTTAANTDIRTSVAGLVAQRWYHAAITWSGLSGKCYLNGNLAHSVAATPANRSTPSTLNISGKNNTDIDGRIAAFKVYNKELSATEINQNFAALRGRFGI